MSFVEGVLAGVALTLGLLIACVVFANASPLSTDENEEVYAALRRVKDPDCRKACYETVPRSTKQDKRSK